MMESTPLVLVVGQVILLITTIAAAWLKNHKDAADRLDAIARAERERLWVVEDRRMASELIISTAKAEAEATRIRTEAIANAVQHDAIIQAKKLAADTITQAAAIAATLKHETEQHNVRVHQALQEVRHEAKAAYREANDVNIKMNALVAMFNTVQAGQVEQTGQIQQVAAAQAGAVQAAQAQAAHLITKKSEQLDKVVEQTTDTSDRVKDIQAKVTDLKP